ncbi:HNH endonuclease signature motif containing protein [Moorena sp. SIO4E2]|uniref:HNH endonuclease n=1 Tax=Moorena sp. SIO4E2 TaxID=2607826 RepID=UPI00338DAF5A
MYPSKGQTFEKAKREMCLLWSDLRRSRRFANKDGDLMETHHIVPRALGGTKKLSNLELLHLHCHDQIHGKRINTRSLDINPW